MADLKIRIGASVNADMGAVVFEPLVKAAQRARGQIRKAMDVGPEVAKDQNTAAQKAIAFRMDLDKKAFAAHLQRSRDAAKLDANARIAADKNATAIEIANIKAREQAQKNAIRSVEAATRQLQSTQRASGSVGGGVSYAGSAANIARGAAGTMVAIGSRAVGVAADIARGAGVNLSVADAVKKRTSLESAATALANQGYIEGAAGSAGQKQDPRAIMADIQRTGQKFAIDQGTLSAGLESFVGKTGELQTGRALMEAMATTAKATGADFEDVAAAAGAISNKLGDIPNKAQAINKVMLALAGQGKVGAVEIKDLATQMEKLTSQASKFRSNAGLTQVVGSEGGANIAMLGVLAQAARRTEKGTAAQATQSAMAFVRDLTGGTAQKRLAHLDIWADKGKTTLKDPQEVIKSLLSDAKGNQARMAYLQPNQNSRAVVNAFMDPYMKAYNATSGTKAQKDVAGRAAVDAAFDELKKATLSETAQKEALGAAMDTTASKAEVFQQRLDQIIGDMAEKVMPALVKLAPIIETLAGKFASVATWTAENPGMAITAAIVASIGKAAIGEAVSKGLGGVLGSSAGLGGLTVAAATITIAAATMVYQDDKKRQREAVDGLDALLSASKKATNKYDIADATIQSEMAKEPGKRDQAKIDKAQQDKDAAKEDIAYFDARLSEEMGVYKKVNTPKSDGPLGGVEAIGQSIGTWINSLTGNTEGTTRKDVADAAAVEARLADVKAATDRTNAILGAGLRVTNLAEITAAVGPTVSGNGRTGPQ